MPVEIRTGNHFWLRDEVKPGERRTPILPEHAKKLIDAGHRVTVESSTTRCVKDEEYVAVGCEIVKSGTWRSEAPKDAFILGLKELDVEDSQDALSHRHVYFGHAYKNQTGWQDLLRRFIEGQGALLDLEFLTFENGVRVAAFGRCAGFIGMAVGVMTWCLQQQDRNARLPTLSYYDDFTHLTNSMRELLKGRKPKVLVIGALGRCGRGAVSLAEQVGLDPIKWDLEETKAGGPFPQLLDVDILVNCIYLSKPIAPFVTSDMLQSPSRALSVVVDVSCDFTNPNNPIPIYKEGTTFFKPTVRIVDGEKPVDVVSIDHLPSLVPWESSKEFADALIDHLVVCDDSEIWARVRKLFEEKSAPLRI